MRFPDHGRSTALAEPNEGLNTVTKCPFCASERVTTTSKTLSASTYWRCHACGEIWNPGRTTAATPFRGPRW